MTTIGLWFHTFIRDEKVLVILLLVAIDFVLGVLAAVKTKTFKLSYVAAFAHDDLLAKVVPYFVVYAAALTAGQTDIVIPGLDLGIVAGTLFGIVVAAMVGSIYKSLRDLGLPALVPANIDGALT